MLGGFLLHSVVKVEFPLTRCEICVDWKKDGDDQRR